MWNPLGLTSYPAKKWDSRLRGVIIKCQWSLEEVWLEGNPRLEWEVWIPQLRWTVLFPQRRRSSGNSRCSAEQGEGRSVVVWTEEKTVRRNRRLWAAQYVPVLTATWGAHCYSPAAARPLGHRCFWIDVSSNSHSSQPHLMLFTYSCYHQLLVFSAPNKILTQWTICKHLPMLWQYFLLEVHR